MQLHSVKKTCVHLFQLSFEHQRLYLVMTACLGLTFCYKYGAVTGLLYMPECLRMTP